MTTGERTVGTVDALVDAAGDAAVGRIVVDGQIRGLPTLRLAPGQRLTGTGPGAVVGFADQADGIRLSRDNELTHLRIEVDPDRRAITTDTTVDHLGTLRLAGVTTVGQVELLIGDRTGGGHVEVDGLDVVAADLRARTDRPTLLGVGAMPGAFTLWNRRPDATVTANLRGLSAGREDAPIRGSGIVVAGASPEAGTPASSVASAPSEAGAGGVEVAVLDTGAIYTDGGLAEGTHDTITGGVFVVYGAHVRQVHNRGPVTTYGVNDMVLDNWGTVDSWLAEAPLTSYGRSGVGFVNFGAIGALRITAPIETHGTGARGFNVYRLDGHRGPTVGTAEFDLIVTHADAAIGIQVGQPIGRLVVRRGISTHGGTGESLVRGALTRLSAYALSVQPGGRIDAVEVGGALASAGAGVAAVEIGGEVGSMRVGGGIHARGVGADGLRVAGGVTLRDTVVRADDGVAVRVVGARAVALHGVDARGARGDVVVGGS